jgi:hypothetical protein
MTLLMYSTLYAAEEARPFLEKAKLNFKIGKKGWMTVRGTPEECNQARIILSGWPWKPIEFGDGEEESHER